MRRRSVLWAFFRKEFGYKKNNRFGFTAAVAIGIGMVLWSFTKPVITIWVPLLEQLPAVGGLPEFALIMVSAGVWFTLVFYVLGLFVRLPALLAAYVGADHARALRFAYWLRRDARFLLFRPFKHWYRSILRIFVRSSSMMATLDQLFVVTVPYLGGTYDAWVTKVQRVWSHDACVGEDETSCNASRCTNGTLTGYRLWVFLADWPVMAMGRPLRYWMEECRVPSVTASEAASQIATLGITATINVHERRLTEHDVRRAIGAIEESEPSLVVAGVIDPEFAEELWIQRGTLDPEWRK